MIILVLFTISMYCYRDDHDMQVLISRTKTKVVLVDHHVMATRDQFLIPLVTEIIDHR